MRLMKQSRQETLIYLAAWVVLFAAPLLSLYVRTVNDPTLVFNWAEVFIVWRKFALFLALFLVHNYLLAPLLVYKYRRVVYFSIVTVVIALFTVYQCTSRPERPDRRPPHERLERPDNPDRPELPDIPENPGKPELPENPGIPENLEFPGDPDFDERPMPPRFEEGHRPPLIIGEHDILAIVVLILMFGVNVGIKGYFRSRHDRQRLSELEHENLEQQLEYLRYQINPHFFMNTLNNIHALVDIDPVKAKDTIVELSKMMRFVLYEGNKQGVPLSREFDFIRHYVALMQLRFTDKVKISLDLPQMAPDRQIPPLILITFIENAFKHGVSYKHDSFITIKAVVKAGRLQFECRNTKAEQPNQEKGGVGLRNVRQRLDLLFDENYTLRIQDEAEIYSVELEIPLT